MNYDAVKEIASELKDLTERLNHALKENPNLYVHPWDEHTRKTTLGYDVIDNDGGE